MTPLGMPVVPELNGKQQISEDDIFCGGVMGAAVARKLSSDIASGCESGDDESDGETMTRTLDVSRAAADAQRVRRF